MLVERVTFLNSYLPTMSAKELVKKQLIRALSAVRYRAVTLVLVMKT